MAGHALLRSRFPTASEITYHPISCSLLKDIPIPTSLPSAHAVLRGETKQLIHKFLTSDKREKVSALPATRQETEGVLTCLVY